MRPRLVEDESDAWDEERAFGGKARFRRRQWVGALVLVLVLFLSGFAALVPRLFAARSAARGASAEQAAEIARELAALGPRVQDWIVAHAGGFPGRLEHVAGDDARGADLLDPWGRLYVLAREGEGFTLATLDAGAEAASRARFALPLILLVGELRGETVYVLDGRDTRDLAELEARLRELARTRGGERLHVVAPPGTSRELSGAAADLALRAGFEDVAFRELER